MTEPEAMGAETTARRRMAGSGLAGRPFDRPEEVVRWHGAMQAQDYGPAKWSVGQRSRDLSDTHLDRALADGAIVRTHVLRPTWHFVAREDVRWLLALTGPRVQRHNGPRYRELGLDGRIRAHCEGLIGSALEGGNRLTRAEIGRILEGHRVDVSGQRLPYILMHAELEGLIGSGGLAGKQHTYALLDERVPGQGRFDREEALVELTHRYLRSHGPATAPDLRWWASLTAADVDGALSRLGPEVKKETMGDVTFWSMASETGRVPGGGTGRLLQAYDELLVGYTRSRYFGDPRGADARAAWRDRTLPTGVALVGGRVVGHWRRRVSTGSVAVEVVTYEPPRPSEARALRAEAGRLGRFLARPATVDLRPRG